MISRKFNKTNLKCIIQHTEKKNAPNIYAIHLKNNLKSNRSKTKRNKSKAGNKHKHRNLWDKPNEVLMKNITSNSQKCEMKVSCLNAN